MKYLNHMRQYFHILFLIHRLAWMNMFSVNNSTAVQKCEQHFVFWLLKLKLFVSWRVWRPPFYDLYFCLGIKFETPGLITRYNWVKQETIFIHRLKKKNSWEACSLSAFCSSVKECRINPAQIFRSPRFSTKILWIVSLQTSSSSSIIRNHSTISSN